MIAEKTRTSIFEKIVEAGDVVAVVVTGSVVVVSMAGSVVSVAGASVVGPTVVAGGFPQNGLQMLQ